MNTEEKLLHLMEKLEAKEQMLKQQIEKKATASQNIKRLKNEIAAIKEEIKMASRDDLGEFLEQHGIDFDDVRTAVKNGLFNKLKQESDTDTEILKDYGVNLDEEELTDGNRND